MPRTQELRGELRDDLVRAHGPRAGAGRSRLTLDRPVGRHHQPQLPGRGGRRPTERWVIRLAGNDTHLLGISREVEHAATVAAAGVGVGPEVTAFIRPEGYLVTRFIEGSPVSDEAVHKPETLRRVADSLRRIHDGPAIPGLFVPLRIVEAYRALALARGVADPARVRAGGRDRPADRAGLPGRAPRAAAVPQRPARTRTSSTTATRIRIVDWEYAGMGDPFFDLGNFSINHELTPDEDERPPRGLRRRRSGPPGSRG